MDGTWDKAGLADGAGRKHGKEALMGTDVMAELRLSLVAAQSAKVE